MIMKIMLTFLVISIFIAPILCAIGSYLEDNFYGFGEVIGAILLTIGELALIIDAIIVNYGIIDGAIKLIWE